MPITTDEALALLPTGVSAGMAVKEIVEKFSAQPTRTVGAHLKLASEILAVLAPLADQIEVAAKS